MARRNSCKIIHRLRLVESTWQRLLTNRLLLANDELHILSIFPATYPKTHLSNIRVTKEFAPELKYQLVLQNDSEIQLPWLYSYLLQYHVQSVL